MRVEFSPLVQHIILPQMAYTIAI